MRLCRRRLDAFWRALRWRLIKHYVSIGIGIPQNLWQKRYWEHCITSEKDFETHMNYLHHNPVNHGYVEKAADWKYSSFQYFVDKGVYPEDWGYADETQNDFGEP